MKKLHLISNAHLDPVWQWEWEEGASAAVSTFRAAADFCEEFDGYVFNHNEVILYQWVEEYEPALFARIQRLVREGKWHIMGGWYLQPDCNMPSGESFVRQMLLGKTYFRDKFGVEPTTAINFDSFGHTRGLVQIMRQAGYDSYIFMRPDGFDKAPAQEFAWKGFNGSEIIAHRISGGYNTLLGEAHLKIDKLRGEIPDGSMTMVLWGVGNHGGGPSRADLRKIREMMDEASGSGCEIVHSTPEAYFREVRGTKEFPAYEGDLNPRFVGCYTSMIRIKQKHRQLENELYMTEKMLSAAAQQTGLAYPADDLREAAKDLMTAQFHDILPGTSIQPAEEAALRLLDHGLEIVARLKARAFFALAAGQPKAESKEYPVLVYNPHPFPVRGVFECEFMLEDQNWKDEFSMPVAYQGGARIPSQPEKELSNLTLDWRKRVVFEAELAPSSMNRFDCRIEMLERKPEPELQATDGVYRFSNGELSVVVNAETGLIDEYAVGGESFLLPGAFRPVVVQDNEDPWRMDTNAFSPDIGAFSLMSPGAGTDFSGVKGRLVPSVRVVEDGEVRTVIEAVLSYGASAIVLTYRLPKRGTEIEVRVRAFWNEKDKMLKLSIPTALRDGSFVGQTAFGAQELPSNGDEAVAQKWVAVHSEKDGLAVTCINDGIYGSDCREGEIRLSLLRSPGYCAHPIGDRPLMPQDRFSPRIDQGERQYVFWLNAGPLAERRAIVDREADVRNERPYALSFFPSGDGEKPGSFVRLEEGTVQLSAFKKEERGEGYILRLFEPTGSPQSTYVSIPSLGLRHEVRLNGFEIRTLRLEAGTGTLEDAKLCEL
ncbi:alpha-mannosidase [Cohnella sp. CIP 111063]|uniref:glycoside hydrolase family 38 N-terminal domain-containing protein n=1 Tax=unclassified Cohnella TaxID=2636738 RepID=UPI000B8C0CBA|nr:MULTISPECIES: alpha-mannosidase [unclassified Cohnella]OXS54035.1 alpha-mannosidase [Cohnella sp. CIP 111063]PRX62907.1 alpha-mannosidase [Cohnella sp. SGD-V74]